jgi:hypothetical protein
LPYLLLVVVNVPSPSKRGRGGHPSPPGRGSAPRSAARRGPSALAGDRHSSTSRPRGLTARIRQSEDVAGRLRRCVVEGGVLYSLHRREGYTSPRRQPLVLQRLGEITWITPGGMHRPAVPAAPTAARCAEGCDLQRIFSTTSLLLRAKRYRQSVSPMSISGPMSMRSPGLSGSLRQIGLMSAKCLPSATPLTP